MQGPDVSTPEHVDALGVLGGGWRPACTHTGSDFVYGGVGKFVQASRSFKVSPLP